MKTFKIRPHTYIYIYTSVEPVPLKAQCIVELDVGVVSIVLWSRWNVCIRASYVLMAARSGSSQGACGMPYILATKSGTQSRSVAEAKALPSRPSPCGCMRLMSLYNFSSSSVNRRWRLQSFSIQPATPLARQSIHALKSNIDRIASSRDSPILDGVIVLLIAGTRPRPPGGSCTHVL